MSVNDTSQVIIKIKNSQQTSLYKESFERLARILRLKNGKQKLRDIPQVFVDLWVSLNSICN